MYSMCLSLLFILNKSSMSHFGKTPPPPKKKNTMISELKSLINPSYFQLSKSASTGVHGSLTLEVEVKENYIGELTFVLTNLYFKVETILYQYLLQKQVVAQLIYPHCMDVICNSSLNLTLRMVDQLDDEILKCKFVKTCVYQLHLFIGYGLVTFTIDVYTLSYETYYMVGLRHFEFGCQIGLLEERRCCMYHSAGMVVILFWVLQTAQETFQSGSWLSN